MPRLVGKDQVRVVERPSGQRELFESRELGQVNHLAVGVAPPEKAEVEDRKSVSVLEQGRAEHGQVHVIRVVAKVAKLEAVQLLGPAQELLGGRPVFAVVLEREVCK